VSASNNEESLQNGRENPNSG